MLFPQYISSLSPYQPGKPISELARELNIEENLIIKLASNENPLGMSPKARVALLKAVEHGFRYPDGGAYELKKAICQQFNLDPQQIIPGNGSDNLLELIAKSILTTQDSAIYSEYAFAVYGLVTQACGAEKIIVPAKDYAHDLDAMLEAIRPNTKIIFIANPNNPTGTFIQPQYLKSFINQVPRSILVVLDEAYTDFLPKDSRYNSFDWVQEFEHLLVCRTFSKAYGLAGIRVGFAVCHPNYAQTIQNIRLAFNVNLLAQEAAIAALGDEEFLEATFYNNEQGKAYLCSGFKHMGLEYIPSYANFITFHHPKASEIHQQLLNHGIIIRPIVNYGMPNSLRVSIGLPQENERFLSTLHQILHSITFQGTVQNYEML
jgi:histidinol-phosphate aminotransferase